MALEMGCSLRASSAPRSPKASLLTLLSLTAISPLVRVPVLSKTAYLMDFKISSTSGFLIRIPCFAPLPTAETIAIGVASPKAHGHEMMSTDTLAKKANSTLPVKNHHPSSVTREISITEGTKMLETLSAKRPMGIFWFCASPSSDTMLANSVAWAGLRTCTFMNPALLIVPAMTSWPTFLYTGKGSPVIMDVSISALPSMIFPSHGIASPDFTTTTSPTANASTATSSSLPSSLSTRACLGERSMRCFRVSVALALERSSKYLPSSTKAIIITAPSK